MSEQGYTALTVTQLTTLLSQDRCNFLKKPVVITFDDGFADFFLDALPVLNHYNFVATLYITTRFIGGTSRWLRRERETERRMLTWDQIAEINAQGIECGAHTHTHPQLDLLPLFEARREIVRSKAILEDHLGHPIFSFAYPYGYHSFALQRIVKDAGYTSACAVKYEMGLVPPVNLFSLPRLLVHADTTVNSLAVLLNSDRPPLGTALYKRARVPAWRLLRYCLSKFPWDSRAAQ
jgi:peptidoglycan/xylan/chitin deacetylase (PgdA/CDA1 family)